MKQKENHLLASSHLSVRLSVCPYKTTLIPMHGFLSDFIFEDFFLLRNVKFD